MSLIGPRGRHRAPSKIQVRFNSAARVTATVAVSGGLVAAVAGQQSAHAEGVAALSPAAQRSAETTITAAHAKALVAAYEQGDSVVDLAVRSKHVKPKPPTRTTTQPATPETTTQAPQRRTTEDTSRSSQRQDPTPSQQPTTPPKTSKPKPPPEPAQPPENGGGSAHGGVIAIAKQYVGTPYVYGGSSPSGFDCSGFTMYVFGKAGISIPRTASAQQAAATSVSSPQPGDLVFFGSPAYHVGIYLGNGMMIDSPKPGKTVQVRKIWDTPSGYGRP